MRANQMELAGKPIPKGVTSWSIKNENGERCAYPTPDGAEAFEFPVGDLTVSNIRRCWGPGTYRVTFIVEKDGERRPKGGRSITVNAKKKASVDPTSVQSADANVPKTHPLHEAFSILDVIDRRANAQTDRQMRFVETILQSTQNRTAQDAALSQFGERIAGAISQLEQRIAGLEEDDDEDGDGNDDDDDDAREAKSSGPFTPGVPIGQTAVAEALNGITSMLAGLAPAAQLWGAAKLEELAAQTKARADATAKSAPQLNGVTTPPSSEEIQVHEQGAAG